MNPRPAGPHTEQSKVRPSAGISRSAGQPRKAKEVRGDRRGLPTGHGRKPAERRFLWRKFHFQTQKKEIRRAHLRNLGKGFHWQELIDEGAYPNIKELAKAIGIDYGVVAKAIRLTWLSPKIIHKIIIGEVDISMQTLRRSFPIV